MIYWKFDVALFLSNLHLFLSLEKRLVYMNWHMISIIRLTKELPCYEEDFALLALVICDEIEVEDGVPAIIDGEGGGEVVVALSRATQLVHHHGLGPLINLEDYIPVNFLPFQGHEGASALIRHIHTRSSLITTT